ncbi:speckle-type POZ protein B [Caerostris extrusa]|uniref:Speckle-type POZ protein B n=1 Tax=Caerostris extrusa TaxID=172846 RepID=A0AAV4W6X7_CAEEX|nr:speckle-type POZ protein B [Caerostris extrusa]
MESIAESQRAPFTFIWTIEHFSPQTCLSLYSPSFIVESMENTRWYIHLNEVGYRFCCSLIREGNKDTGPKSIEIDFEIAVLDDNGSVLISEKGHNVFKKELYRTYLFELDDPLWEKWRKVSSRDILTIRCRMWKTHGQKRVRSTSADMCFACSKLRVEQNSFIWSIRDFSSLLVKQTKILSWQCPTNEEPKITLNLHIYDYKNKEEVNIFPTLEKAVIVIMPSAFPFQCWTSMEEKWTVLLTDGAWNIERKLICALLLLLKAN